MKFFVADERIPKKALAALTERGFSPILLPPSPALAKPVASHPDMLLFFADRIYSSKEYYEEAMSELTDISRLSGLEILLSDTKIAPEYPHDVAFNALFLDGKIFCKASSLDRGVAKYALSNGIEIVDVKQGYAKCSVCKVSERAIITSDASIKKAALAHGVDVLSVIPGHVVLPGYDEGFIGGATGADENCIYFCGALDLHPNGSEIAEFCKKHEKEPVSLSDEPLCDVGTIFFFS